MISHDQSTNFISVCDELCVLDDSESTAFSTKCKLPKLSTTYSNENFGIASESENLNTGSYFGTFENNSMIFDSNLIQVPTSTATEDCHVGIGFKSGHVGMIS